MWYFILGLFLGCFIGVFAMALLAMAKQPGEDTSEYQ
jgi:hypothetical protein